MNEWTPTATVPAPAAKAEGEGLQCHIGDSGLLFSQSVNWLYMCKCPACL